MSAASVINPQDIESPPQMPNMDRILGEIHERQAMYVQLLGQGWGKREAARSSGYPAMRARKPIKAIETPELKAKMQLALKRQGATMDKAARVVSEAMNAKVTASFEGKVIESEFADHKTRVQAAKVTADLMGLTERSASANTGSSVTLTLAGPLAERFMQSMGGADAKTVEGE